MAELHEMSDDDLLWKLCARYGLAHEVHMILRARLSGGRYARRRVDELEARVAELLALVPPDRLPAEAPAERPVYQPSRRNE